jgi:hypothetical protein
VQFVRTPHHRGPRDLGHPITVNLACRPAESEDFAACGPGMKRKHFMSAGLKGEKKS